MKGMVRGGLQRTTHDGRQLLGLDDLHDHAWSTARAIRERRPWITVGVLTFESVVGVASESPGSRLVREARLTTRGDFRKQQPAVAQRRVAQRDRERLGQRVDRRHVS